MTEPIWIGLTSIEAAWRAGQLGYPFASVDTRPKGGDSAQTEAPFTSGAVPREDEADAQGNDRAAD